MKEFDNTLRQKVKKEATYCKNRGGKPSIYIKKKFNINVSEIKYAPNLIQKTIRIRVTRIHKQLDKILKVSPFSNIFLQP